MKEQFLLFKIRNWSDPESFGKLYDLYVGKIYRFIFFKVGSKEEAQDLTSETFFKAWQYLTSADHSDIRNIRAFLYRVARNMVIDHYRVRGVENEWQENMEQVIETVPSSSLDQDFDRLVDNEILLKKIQQLRPAYQEVILMRYIEELNINEIAEAINRSKGATRVLIHRALQELKKLLQ